MRNPIFQLWDEAHDNTKLFKVDGFYTTNYLQGCKTCDKIVNYNTTREMQIVGNCHQVIAHCHSCNKPLKLDQHKLDLIQVYLWEMEQN